MPCFFVSTPCCDLLCFILLCRGAACHPSIHPSIKVTIHSAPEPALHVAGPMGPPQMRSFCPAKRPGRGFRPPGT